ALLRWTSTQNAGGRWPRQRTQCHVFLVCCGSQCPMSLILRQVLDHPVLTRAQPTVLSGHDHLDHAVRWVHTADLYDIAPLLRGDELLLTNGVGLVGVDEIARRIYVRRIAESGVAALCFEVGRTFAEVPGEMIEEAVEVGLPIVELQPALRFTEVA